MFMHPHVSLSPELDQIRLGELAGSFPVLSEQWVEVGAGPYRGDRFLVTLEELARFLFPKEQA